MHPTQVKVWHGKATIVGGGTVRTVVLAVLSLAVALEAGAAETKFARGAAVKLLGYDPEISAANQCETRANTARLVRVALTKAAPAAERVQTHLAVAGLIGAARAICPKASSPEPLAPFAAANEKLEQTTCDAAAGATATTGKLRQALDDLNANAHPDLAAGYADGLVAELLTLAKACYDHEKAWARLDAQAQILARQAESTRTNKPCTLWRRAFSAELRTANTVGETKGRAAGLAYLKGNPMIALAGSRTLCTDPVGRALELTNYQLTETVITALPEKPAK